MDTIESLAADTKKFLLSLRVRSLIAEKSPTFTTEETVYEPPLSSELPTEHFVKPRIDGAAKPTIAFAKPPEIQERKPASEAPLPEKESVQVLPPTIQEKYSPLFQPLLTLLSTLKIPTSESLFNEAKAHSVRFGFKAKRAIPEVPILIDTRAPFFTSLATAISKHLAPSKTLNVKKIDSAGKWDKLSSCHYIRLFILPDSLLSEYPLLSKNMDIKPGGKRFLFDKPLVLLPDISLYEKDPQLKKALWNMLCTMLKSNNA